MKVLYIGHMRERSGFSIAAENYVKALVAAGVDMVVRNIKLSPTNHPSSQFIAELEKKSLDGCTHVIQHVLAHHMSYVSGMKNIGLFVYDLNNPSFCEWDRYLSCMDEVWVPNEENLDMLDVTTYYVPHACDTTRYSRQYAPLDIPEIGGTFNLYTIADISKRKNLRDIIVAFHSEFHANEPVNLILKVSKFGVTPEQTVEIVTSDLNRVKTDLKLYPNINDYRPEILITHSLTDDQIGSIHTSGHCYVNTSHGEAWGYPMMDAWAYGNHIIYYNNGKMYNYLKAAQNSFELVHPILCHSEPCYGYSDTFPQLGSAREKWLSSNVPGLMRHMRNAYETWLTNPNKLVHRDYEEYSYERVGETMKGLLSA